MPEIQASGRDLIGHLWRYGLVGLANTAIGLAVIYAVQFGLHAPDLVANACGYAAGILFGFVLNRGFVFRSTSGVGRAGPRYMAAVACAYGLNVVVLIAARRLLAPYGDPGRAAAQAAALGAYTVTLFVLSRYWVFGAATR